MTLMPMVMNRQKPFHKRYSAIKAWTPLVFFCIHVLIGCTKDETKTPNVRKIEKDIRLKISEIPRALEKASGAYGFGMSVSTTIARLPDKEQQIKWYHDAVNAVLQTEIGHLSLYDQRRSIDSINELCGAIGAGLYKSEKSLEEAWNIRIRILTWKKSQMTRLEDEYARIKPKDWTKPIPESLFRRVRRLRGLIKNVKVNLNAEITTRERYFWDDEYLMSAECKTKVQQKFEALLGRPIRTLKQIDDDLEKRADAFRRAEEAAMSKTNRPPPLVLIDGTK